MIAKKYRWVNGLIMLSSFILIFGVVSKIIMHTQTSIREKVNNTISVTETRHCQEAFQYIQYHPENFRF